MDGGVNMPINTLITHVCDLNGALTITPLRHTLVHGDQLGDQFEIAVNRGYQPVSLANASVYGYFIRESDGSTVFIVGNARDNTAIVKLPESCYAYPGRFTLTIRIVLGNERHAVYVCEGAIIRSSTDEIVDPGNNIPDLLDLLEQSERIEDAIKRAGLVVDYISGITVGGHRLPPGRNVTVEKSDIDGHINLEFGIPQGEAGADGKPGMNGVTVPISGWFTLGGDDEGNLYAYYGGTDSPPQFEVDENHNIYYVIPDAPDQEERGV